MVPVQGIPPVSGMSRAVAVGMQLQGKGRQMTTHTWKAERLPRGIYIVMPESAVHIGDASMPAPRGWYAIPPGYDGTRLHQYAIPAGTKVTFCHTEYHSQS